MKKAFALVSLLALVFAGCRPTTNVTDPTKNSYQAYSTTISPLESRPTTATATESTTVPAESESKPNALDTPKETEAAKEPTVPLETVPSNESMETQPPATKLTEPPHTHSYTSNKVVATCTSKGYTLHKCSCGSSYTSDETAALGHSWGNWTVVTQPTTQQEGKQTRTCSRCGATDSQSIPKVEAPALEWSDLDLNKAMAVGNQYAASRYGCVPDTSLNINTPNVGYNFPNSLSRGEIISYVPSLAGSYQEAIEFEIKGNVDLFVQDFIYSGYTEDDVRGAKINCWCVIQNNQLWFYVFYK